MGAAILDRFGNIVGVGATQQEGSAHAEVMALRAAQERAKGGTLVVTLEPCNHHGRTPPCTDAIIEAGIESVYYLVPDPNPLAAGGAKTLEEAGLNVARVHESVPELTAWLTWVRTGLPHVTLKIAQTLDGCVAAADGTSQWITSAASRAHAHRDRARRHAIIVGAGTARIDKPGLTARGWDGRELEGVQQPQRIIAGGADMGEGYRSFPTVADALRVLGQEGAYDVLVEGGPTIAASLMRENAVDAVRVYLAPYMLGNGLRSIGGEVSSTLADATRFALESSTRIGDDIVVDYVRRRSTLKNF
ncbi:bifunctional diaminohydroxyphosphoribosylaminopyrimidine deaminase/5-amino-6-(5-phosphoribosylamino)uracil reductase RibD [Corynebacterium tapiri]